MAKMDNADGFARVTGLCGDTIEIWLRVRNDIITKATFLTDGCATTITAGSMVTELVKEKTIIQALQVGKTEIILALGGMPEEVEHCALLASNTLKAAVRDYLE
jgi:nitrogen fixation NifU-like protein